MARRRLLGQPLRVVLVVLGVALGTSLWLAGLLSSASSLSSFAKLVGFDDERFPIIVRGNGAALSDDSLQDLLPRLSDDFEIVVQQYGELEAESTRQPGVRHRLKVVGVATGGSAESISGPDLSSRLGLSADSMRRFSVAEGDQVILMVGDRSSRVVVDRLPESAVGGEAALVSLQTLQDLSVAAPSVLLMRARDQSEESVSRLNQLFRGFHLPWVAETRSERVERGRELLAAFRTNIFMMFGLTIAVGILVIWNALTISLSSAERDLALLRALGAGSFQVFALVMCEALMMSVVGALLGITVGTPIAVYVANAMTGSVRGLYGSGQGIGDLEWLSGWDFRIQAALLALAAGAVAGGLVAGRACLVAPASGVRQLNVFPNRAGLILPIILVAATTLFCAALCGESAMAGYVASFALAAAVPAAAVVGIGLAKQRQKAIPFPLLPLWLLAVRNACSIRFGHRVSIALLCVSTMFIVAFGILIASFASTLRDWMDSRLQADLFVGAAVDHPMPSSFHMSPAVVSAFERVAGVAEISRVDQTDIVVAGVVYQLNAVDLDVNLRRGVYKFSGDLWAGTGARVFASETAARALNRKVGEPVAILGKNLTLAGVIREMSTERPMLIVDRADSPVVIPGTRSISVYLKPGSSPAEVLSELRPLAEQVGAAVYDQGGLKSYIEDLFEQTFLVTRAVRWLVVIFALVAVVGAVWQVLYERANEIFVLFSLGCTPAEFSRVVAAETLVIVLWSIPFGVCGGAVLGTIMVDWVNPASFGWRLDVVYGGWESAWLLVTMIVAVLFSVWCLGRGFPYFVRVGRPSEE
jgi:putative ABC transport system permease protein